MGSVVYDDHFGRERRAEGGMRGTMSITREEDARALLKAGQARSEELAHVPAYDDDG
jgi:hypothetical protein